jgi:large subunit ribosomal protein L18
MSQKKEKRQRRHRRIRAKVFGSSDRPRLCVFKSSNHIYAQIINDEKEKSLFSASSLELKKAKTEKKGGKSSVAFEVGKLIAKKALEKKIEKVVFDRGGYLYHGRVKSLADGAREGGLKF